jgi:hypothetical protein
MPLVFPREFLQHNHKDTPHLCALVFINPVILETRPLSSSLLLRSIPLGNIGRLRQGEYLAS